MKIKLLLITLVSLQASISYADESDLVKKSFDTYVSSILNDKGEEAYGVVDKRTRDYYSWLQDSSVHFTKAEYQKLGIVDKLQVVIMRHRIPPKTLIDMTGKELFVYAVKKGWVGKNGVSNLGIGEVIVNENFASANVISRGTVTPLKFHFYKEKSTWKIDITEITKWGEAAFAQQQKASKMTEEEFIFYVTKIASGSPVNGATIYKPLKPRAPKKAVGADSRKSARI